MNQRPTLLMVQLGAVLSCPVPRTTTRQWRCYKWDIGHTAARILRPLKWSEIESERSCCSFLLFSCQAIRKCVPLEHKGLTHYLLALGFMVLFFCFLALVAVLFLQFKIVKPFIGVTTACKDEDDEAKLGHDVWVCVYDFDIRRLKSCLESD